MKEKDIQFKVEFTSSKSEKLEDSKCLVFVDINLIANRRVYLTSPQLYKSTKNMYLYMMRVIRSINCHAHRLMLYFLKICELDGWTDEWMDGWMDGWMDV